jgi:hypothetical protein
MNQTIYILKLSDWKSFLITDYANLCIKYDYLLKHNYQFTYSLSYALEIQKNNQIIERIPECISLRHDPYIWATIFIKNIDNYYRKEILENNEI